ncbi:MAG: putative Uridine kinase [Chloroflexi bacterium]|nr:putative Uridine kinase [Chloroflexota bacterium]
MSHPKLLSDPELFSEALFDKLKCINPGIEEMELYEFRYALNNLIPEYGWALVELDQAKAIEMQINNRDFYSGIQLKPRLNDRIVLDEKIIRLTNMLFVGLVSGQYPLEWVKMHFYFDIRGFYFLHRTVYFTDKVMAHLGGKPFRIFEPRQKQFERCQDIGYKAFKEANAEVDQVFIESVKRLITVRGIPILLAIAGPTAAGKTEIVERLRSSFEQIGRKTAAIELDNFLTDRDYREEQGIYTLGKEALHYEILKDSLAQICQGQKIAVPRYDFVNATSSHDLDGKLKPGCVPIEIEPADVIFIEGNFPFLLAEIVHFIGIKVVYLTDDAVRLKRKWKRDIDYRKKYEPTYFRNRFFKDQYVMAQRAYIPQMEVCDMVVDTTGAAFWVTPEIAGLL